MVFVLKLPVLLYAGAGSADYTSFTFFENFFAFLNRSRTSIYFIGCAVLILQTLHLNYIFERHAVHYKNTFLPALFYVIFACVFNGVDSRITPSLIVQTPLMLVLDIYFDLYKSPRLREKLFNAMLVLGIAILIYLPLAYLILAFWISIFFVKIPSIRDFLVATAGASLPLYFAFVYLYFMGHHEYFLTKLNSLLQFTARISFEESLYELILMGAFGLIILGSSMKLYTNHFKNIIKTRIIQQMLFVFSFITLFLLIFLLQFRYQDLLIFIIPISYLFSYFFMGRWRFLLNEIIAIALFVFIVCIKFYIL